MRVDAKILTIVALALIVFFGVAFRLVVLMPYPKSLFNYRDSPNGRYRAIVSSRKDMRFFGSEFSLYQIRVEPASTDFPDMAVFRMDISDALVPRGLDVSDQHAVDEAIQWSPNSLRVKFKVGVKEAETMVPF